MIGLLHTTFCTRSESKASGNSGMLVKILLMILFTQSIENDLFKADFSFLFELRSKINFKT